MSGLWTTVVPPCRWKIAIRLSKAFGSQPEIWLKMQLAFDLAAAQRTAGSIKVRRFKPVGAELLERRH